MIVSLGLAAAASYFWDVVSVWGRVALFTVAGAAMLAAGIKLEKQDRYRILGRSLVGGGWATLFMTAFGMHHVAAIRVIPSLELDLFVVLAVTAAMARDTLRYDSQLVTGLAFGLGFFTVTQSHDSPWSLLANVMLAGGLIFIVLRRKWYELELFGLLASYVRCRGDPLLAAALRAACWDRTPDRRARVVGRIAARELAAVVRTATEQRRARLGAVRTGVVRDRPRR